MQSVQSPTKVSDVESIQIQSLDKGKAPIHFVDKVIYFDRKYHLH